MLHSLKFYSQIYFEKDVKSLEFKFKFLTCPDVLFHICNSPTPLHVLMLIQLQRRWTAYFFSVICSIIVSILVDIHVTH